MDARPVSLTVRSYQASGPLPVIVVLGSSRAANGLVLALASEGYHTILAYSWSHVRSLSGFLKPDLLVSAPGRVEEVPWRQCFDPGVPEVALATIPGLRGLRWPLPWSALLSAVRTGLQASLAMAASS